MRVDAGLVGVVALGFAMVLVIALTGGGYETAVRNQIGIIVCWALLLGAVSGLLPLRRPGGTALAAAILFVLFVLWLALSLSWTESTERTMADLGRVATLLGVFLLAIGLRSTLGARRMVGALGAAIALVALVALISRLLPDVFPEAARAARALPESANRLGFPLDYWNGLGALVGIGLPLLLHVATSASSHFVRAAAASSLPMMILVAFLTYSRSGAAAGVIALAVYLLLCNDRLLRAISLVTAGILAMPLVLLADHWEFVADGPIANSGSSGQGVTLLVIVAGTALLASLIELWVSKSMERKGPPAWARPSRRVTIWFAAVLGTVLLAAAATFIASGKASEAWNEFKAPASVTEQGADRFQAIGGNHRYQFWQAAFDQFETKPLTGRGSGTFEYWSNRSEDTAGFVRDAHSLYLETLGELGLVGFILLVGLFGLILVSGVSKTIRAPESSRSQMAAAVAGCLGFMIVAAVDWAWELAVLPAVFFLLASVLITAGDSGDRPVGGSAWALRGVISVLAVGMIVAIVIPLSSSSLVDQSRDAGRAGDLSRSLDLAREASEVEPGAATPYLQQALVLEAAGEPTEGLKAAREATEREPTNWRTWLIRFRLEAATGDTEAAVISFKRARRLNANSTLLGSFTG